MSGRTRPFVHFTVVLLALLIIVPPVAFGQEGEEQPDLTINETTRNEVLEGVLKALNEAYVFPETAKKMEQSIRDRMAKNEYGSVASAKEFARKLTNDLQAVSKDKHLRVSYSFEARPKPPENEGPPSPEERARFLKFARSVNFGFEKIERLEGNVGYLDLRSFMGTELAGETAVAAMNFLSNSDALIIDLRQNGGGDPAQVALISTYLFDSDPVHLNSLYWRPGNFTHQWWTLPYVPGTRFGREKDVYVLTSNRTFSAAEEFTYNLQNLKRATIVGETTGGGAHPGGGRWINEHFGVWLPTGRAINPVSGTNWEGTGVKPDIAVPKEQALKTAHTEALKKLVGKATDEKDKERLKRTLSKIEKELEGVKTAAK
ncbi:MAG: peptidase [Acidobacteria bacterium]|nr:MAG: peptidase [Acidobacteriota bacterium]